LDGNWEVPPELGRRIDAVCSRFEAAWRSGAPPHIHDFLDGWSGAEQSALLRELILLDLDYRRATGLPCRVEDYLTPFPEIDPAWLADAVAGISCASGVGGPSADTGPTGRVDCVAGYHLGEQIDAGGMGVVYRARDLGLERDLAVKVLRPEHQNRPELVRRFLAEARIVARLQHPGIPPVHSRGQLPDGRPFFTMKLIHGETLLAQLRGRQHPAEDLPRFVGIFTQVCQAVAYAHSRGILHRDLKPHNVMVGAFDEMQLLDWGLAKELQPGGQARAAEQPTIASDNGQPPVAADPETVDLGPAEEGSGGLLQTQPGQVVGTLPYMPPESARGEISRVDERSDVFGLGAILCEILTGRPPFRGDSEQIVHKVRACDHAEALSGLESCGADAELVRLTKACLAAEPEDRPHDAGQVAERVKAYQVGVEERLRTAERDRAAAQARAEEAQKTALAERRARRRLAGAALALLLLVVGTGSGAWWLRQRQLTADAVSADAMARARLLLGQAREALLAEDDKLRAALEEARKAEQVAATGGASTEVQRQAAALVAELEQEVAAAVRDRRLLAAVLEVHAPREGPKFTRDDRGTLMVLPQPAMEEQFSAAFHDWGLDVDNAPLPEAAARLQERPPAVVVEVIAALDEWTSLRRSEKRPLAAQRLADLAVLLDDRPSSLRRQLRTILERGQLPQERSLALLSAALRPVPVPVVVPLGKDRAQLRQLAERVDPAAEPVLGLLTLTRALRVAGEEAIVEQLLRAALTARPREVVLYHRLGQLLTEQNLPRWAEAVECYRAARALRPDLGVNLARALLYSGQGAESLALLGRMVQERPDDPYLHSQQGLALLRQEKFVEAAKAWRQAIALKPDFAEACVNLGAALLRQEKYAEAEAACCQAIQFKPDDADVYVNLGAALGQQGKYAEAETACRQAIHLKPDLAEAHSNLGFVLICQGKLTQAKTAYRQAIQLKPDDADVYLSLGSALGQQGKYTEAEAACRQAIQLKPAYAEAHYNLGKALSSQGRLTQAGAAYRQAIQFKPAYAEAHYNLGIVLSSQGRLSQAEDAYRQAIALKPNYAEGYVNLGVALGQQGKYAEAEAACRQAIQFKPDDAEAHYNLGKALSSQGRLTQAGAAYRQAIQFKPAYAEAHYNLGIVLSSQGRLSQAEDAYRQAIALKPDYAKVYVNLGTALRQQGKLAEAKAVYCQAIKVKPDLAEAYCNLGNVLHRQGKYAEAEKACRQATKLKPDLAAAHYNLGNALREQGKLTQAEDAYRQAIQLNPADAEAHCNLGYVLQRQGRFVESLAAYRRGHQLGSKQAGWRYPSLQWVQKAESLVALEGKLSAIRQGKAFPASAGEALALAAMSQLKKLHATAARLCAEAFTADPKLAADLGPQLRYHAACCAVLAAAGQGEDSRLLPDKEVVLFRRWACDWLRKDLTAYHRFANQDNPALTRAIQQRLAHWQKDPDLASVRDRAALDRLPDNECTAWQALWRDVAVLLERLQEKEPSTSAPSHRRTP
jgi:Flp pilus assembly protein TadD/serine/threonine protein kinase